MTIVFVVAGVIAFVIGVGSVIGVVSGGSATGSTTFTRARRHDYSIVQLMTSTGKSDRVRTQMGTMMKPLPQEWRRGINVD